MVYTNCTWFTPEIQQTTARNDSVYFNLHSFCAVSSSRSLHATMKHESTINILRVPILSLKDFNQGTHMPEQADSWTSPGWDKRYPMAWTSSMGVEVRFQKGWVDWLVRWIMIPPFLVAEYPKWHHIRKYMFQKDIYIEFRGFMFMFFLCPIWSCVNLNWKISWDVLQIVEQWLDLKVIISAHPGIPQNDMVNKLPRNKMG